MSLASRAWQIFAAITSVGALAAAMVAPVSAAGPVAVTLRITPPSAPIVCHIQTEVSVLVLDASGATIAGKVVRWGMAPVVSSQDAVTETESTTGSQGVAKTEVWIDCIRGSRTLMAQADGAQAQVVLAISDAGMPAPTPTLPPPGLTAAQLTLTVPAAPIVCRQAAEVSVLVLAASGATIAGKQVTWSLDPFGSVDDIWETNDSFTGSQGVATNTVWLACAPGRRVMHATADGASAAIDLSLSAEGMPGTTPTPETTSAPPASTAPGEEVTAPPTSTAPATQRPEEAAGTTLLVTLAFVGGAALLVAAARRRSGPAR